MDDDRGVPAAIRCHFRGCEEPAHPVTYRVPFDLIEEAPTHGQSVGPPVPFCTPHSDLIFAIGLYGRLSGLQAQIDHVWEGGRVRITSAWVEELSNSSPGSPDSIVGEIVAAARRYLKVRPGSADAPAAQAVVDRADGLRPDMSDKDYRMHLERILVIAGEHVRQILEEVGLAFDDVGAQWRLARLREAFGESGTSG